MNYITCNTHYFFIFFIINTLLRKVLFLKINAIYVLTNMQKTRRNCVTISAVSSPLTYAAPSAAIDVAYVLKAVY